MSIDAVKTSKRLPAHEMWSGLSPDAICERCGKKAKDHILYVKSGHVIGAQGDCSFENGPFRTRLFAPAKPEPCEEPQLFDVNVGKRKR